jgi:GT2 family glycosyltransferase
MKSAIHIVLVTYNGSRWIDACLKGIKESTVPCFTWIIDNRSLDDTLEKVKAHQIEKEVCIMDENLGFGRANNIGIAKALKAGAEYVFLLNQDAYLFPDTLEKLLAAAEREDHAVWSPIHLNGKGDGLDRNFGKYYVDFDANPQLTHDAMRGQLKEVYTLPFVNAAAWFIPRKTFETIGGFDPLFSHYGEDDNFCQRIRFHGLTIALNTSVFVCHDRDERDQSRPDEFSEKGLELFRRKLKVKYANPSCTDFPKEYDEEFKRYRSWSFKSKVKLNSRQASGYGRMASIMEDEWNAIDQSRRITVTKGPHFLPL